MSAEETVAVCGDGDGGWMPDPCPGKPPGLTRYVPRPVWEAYEAAEVAWQAAGNAVEAMSGSEPPS